MSPSRSKWSGSQPGTFLGWCERASASGGSLRLASSDAGQLEIAHQAPDPVAADPEAFRVELEPDLASPGDAVVLLVHAGDLWLQLLVLDPTGAGGRLPAA